MHIYPAIVQGYNCNCSDVFHHEKTIRNCKLTVGYRLFQWFTNWGPHLAGGLGSSSWYPGASHVRTGCVCHHPMHTYIKDVWGICLYIDGHIVWYITCIFTYLICVQQCFIYFSMLQSVSRDHGGIAGCHQHASPTDPMAAVRPESCTAATGRRWHPKISNHSSSWWPVQYWDVYTIIIFIEPLLYCFQALMTDNFQW